MEFRSCLRSVHGPEVKEDGARGWFQVFWTSNHGEKADQILSRFLVEQNLFIGALDNTKVVQLCGVHLLRGPREKSERSLTTYNCRVSNGWPYHRATSCLIGYSSHELNTLRCFHIQS